MSKPYPAVVTAAGVKLETEQAREEFCADIHTRYGLGEIVLLHVSDYQDLRSLRANNYLWGVVYKLIAVNILTPPGGSAAKSALLGHRLAPVTLAAKGLMILGIVESLRGCLGRHLVICHLSQDGRWVDACWVAYAEGVFCQSPLTVASPSVGIATLMA